MNMSLYSRRLAIGTATVAALMLGAGAAHAQSQSPAPAAAAPQQAGADTASRLNIGEIYERVTQAGYQDVREIELDDGRYEVKARDAQGQRIKLYVNARSGEVEHGRLDD